MRAVLMIALLLTVGMCHAAGSEKEAPDDPVQKVIERVEQQCMKRRVPMVGRKKAERLAELVRASRPKLVVECGTAIGYSGLWIARELKNLGSGKLITIEIDERSAKEARGYFRDAGVADIIEVKVGDARKICKDIEGPIDFLFLDCGFSNYLPCFEAARDQLADGATVVADNAGIGARGMAEYLKLVRSKYQSQTEWFDIDLPWAKRDALEVTVLRPGK